MKTVALIPLRGGSKSIPKKNIKSLCGKPLCAWVLEAAVNCPEIEQVYVSTDDEEIMAVVRSLDLGVEIIRRPCEFATDEATTESVLLHFMSQVEYETVITIQATSPTLKPFDLSRALFEFRSKEFDSMLSAVRLKRFFWADDGKPLNYDPASRPRRQEFSGTLMENGAFYITKKSVLANLECRLGGKIGLYEMDDSSSLEIDEPDDWVRLESILGS